MAARMTLVPAPEGRVDRASRARRAGQAVAAIVVSATFAATVAGCTPSGLSVASFPAGSIGPATTVGPVVAQTRTELVRVLGERSLVLQDSEAPFRPPEDATFTTTPRAVYQVILPDAPTEGFIVVYEFPDPTTASTAATAQAAYLATGPARVQSPFGTRHIIRLVGSTVVLYSWVPEGASDERQARIQPALETLGVGVPVPS
jgi:hypothetical protein